MNVLMIVGIICLSFAIILPLIAFGTFPTYEQQTVISKWIAAGGVLILPVGLFVTMGVWFLYEGLKP